MHENRLFDILLVEDNPGDIKLITDALAETGVSVNVHSVRDGIDAMRFLRNEPPFEHSPTPAIVLLDLNIPRKDGREVLAEIKSDPVLGLKPVVIFSGSDAPQDISACYSLHANCYVVKPRDLFELTDTVNSLVDFWLKRVKLPPNIQSPETNLGTIR
jgi:chemotaxis family two-component system response regulator Rcp1